MTWYFGLKCSIISFIFLSLILFSCIIIMLGLCFFNLSLRYLCFPLLLRPLLFKVVIIILKILVVGGRPLTMALLFPNSPTIPRPFVWIHSLFSYLFFYLLFLVFPFFVLGWLGPLNVQVGLLSLSPTCLYIVGRSPYRVSFDLLR